MIKCFEKDLNELPENMRKTLLGLYATNVTVRNTFMACGYEQMPFMDTVIIVMSRLAQANANMFKLLVEHKERESCHVVPKL